MLPALFQQARDLNIEVLLKYDMDVLFEVPDAMVKGKTTIRSKFRAGNEKYKKQYEKRVIP